MEKLVYGFSILSWQDAVDASELAMLEHIYGRIGARVKGSS